ncbi:H-2 class I histocompatibility antigen, partial [Huso huso]
THSYWYMYTGITEGNNFPEFVVVGGVDDIQLNYYDSDTKEVIPKHQIMKDAADPDFYKRNTQNFDATGAVFKENVKIAMKRFNQTNGVHTVQQMYGCELDDDRTKRGFFQYGFDGKDFISFDKDSLTWTAPVQQAVITKHKWDADRAWGQQTKAYLETECIEWLQKYIQYGRETLERRVPPAVTLHQRKARGSADTEVLCHVTGFFPRAVEVTWVRDGRDQLDEGVQSGEVLPNQDGTYQLRKILTVSSEEQKGHSYSCQVDHASFTEKQNYIWDPNMRSSDGNEGGPPIGIIAGVIVGVLALAAVIIGVVIWKKKQGGTHSLRYFFMGVSEGTGLPEFVTVGMLDDVQIDYYDSVTKRVIPTQDWMERSEGPEHSLSAVPPAVTLLHRKARGSADTEVLCHVTGFFPRVVEVSWVRDGQDQLDEGVQSGEVLPNQDGTYQLRKILTVSPEEQGKHSYSCQVDHVSLDQKIVKEWDPNMRSSRDGNDGDDELERGEREGGILTVTSEEQGRHSYSCQVDHASFRERQNYIWDPNMRSSDGNEGDDELERGGIGREGS